MENVLYKIVSYPQNSYIILEGEKKSLQFYIIKEGRINLKKDFPVAGEKASEVIGPGDFFGVISAMSQLTQIESALSLTPVVLIGVSYTKFGELIQKNSPLAMKIIRYFSKKLRQFDDKNPGTRPTAISSPQNLNIIYNLAEYYLNLEQNQAAIYMLQSYLKHSPEGEFVEAAKNKLKELGAKESSTEEAKGTNRVFEKDQMVFCENEPGNDLFIVQRGKIRITKLINNVEVQLNIMKPGDIFGEMALLENKPRSASASALEEAELLVINKENFEIMTQKQPQLMTRIITILSERIWNAYRKILNSNLHDTNARVLDMLMILVEKTKIKIASGTFDFEINFADLFKMISATEELDKYVPKFLFTYKFIRVEEGNLVCNDLMALERHVSVIRTKLKEQRALL
jgi:CRP/FNR family transcriptional regulator